MQYKTNIYIEMWGIPYHFRQGFKGTYEMGPLICTEAPSSHRDRYEAQNVMGFRSIPSSMASRV